MGGYYYLQLLHLHELENIRKSLKKKSFQRLLAFMAPTVEMLAEYKSGAAAAECAFAW